MSRQEHYRACYRQLKPGWEDSLQRYRGTIALHVDATTRVLDLGCGHGDFLAEVYARTIHTFGLDPDHNALQKNEIIQHVVTADAEHIPFPEHYFDLVVAAWVLEHLVHPELVFREIYRVLKPGGRVIFLTPNVWNYNVWIIRLIPNVFHDFLVRRLYQRQENDTYPVQYKINSPAQVERILSAIGFTKATMLLNGDPSYISFNDLLFRFACFLETMLDIPALNFARVHLIGTYQK